VGKRGGFVYIEGYEFWGVEFSQTEIDTNNPADQLAHLNYLTAVTDVGSSGLLLDVNGKHGDRLVFACVTSPIFEVAHR
jgi:hypothetical protein